MSEEEGGGSERRDRENGAFTALRRDRAMIEREPDKQAQKSMKHAKK